MKPNPGDDLCALFMKAATVKHASILTKKAMKSTFTSLASCAKQNRWGSNVSPDKISKKQLTQFVQYRIGQGVSKRVVQNQMAHVRRSLHATNRIEFANNVCSNAALLVPSGTRIGTGKVVDLDALEKAIANAAPDTRAWINGMRDLGLRQRELVRCGPSLQVWERQLETGQAISIRFGTKGGKPREVLIPLEKRQEALSTVRSLIDIAKQQDGHVVRSETLDSACHLVGDRLSAIGLKGENSGHSLRRAFAMDQYNHYMGQGYSIKESLSLVSFDLGHGEGRGRWVFNNYLKATMEAA
jgi:integrase